MTQTLAEALGDDGKTEPLPCRRCGKIVQVSSLVMDLARGFNHILHKRGEPVLTKPELVCCPACVQAEDAALSEKSSREADRITAACRLVRQGQSLGRAEFEWLKVNAARQLADAFQARKDSL